MHIMDRFKVEYMLRRDGREPERRTSYPVLTSDYSTFEDIRKMIAGVDGVGVDGIDVLTLVKLGVDVLDVDEAHHYGSDVIGFDHPIGWGQPDGLLSSCPPPVAYGIVDWRDYADPTLIVGQTIEEVRRAALRLIRKLWADDGYFAEGGDGFPGGDPDTATDDEIRDCLQRMYDSEEGGIPLVTQAIPDQVNMNAGRV